MRTRPEPIHGGNRHAGNHHENRMAQRDSPGKIARVSKCPSVFQQYLLEEQEPKVEIAGAQAERDRQQYRRPRGMRGSAWRTPKSGFRARLCPSRLVPRHHHESPPGSAAGIERKGAATLTGMLIICEERLGSTGNATLTYDRCYMPYSSVPSVRERRTSIRATHNL